MDRIIGEGLLCDYIDRFFTEYNEGQAWEMWLHKETGRTWGDFKLQVLEQEDMTQQELETANRLYDRLCERGE